MQADSTLVTAFLDIYSNHSGSSILYVAPGIDSTVEPPDDAFYGETNSTNGTVGSQWARALAQGKHDIYYLYKQSGSNTVNEHEAHGSIVTMKV